MNSSFLSGAGVVFLSSQDVRLLPQGSVHRSLCSLEECTRAEECILTAKYKHNVVIQKHNKPFWLSSWGVCGQCISTVGQLETCLFRVDFPHPTVPVEFSDSHGFPWVTHMHEEWVLQVVFSAPRCTAHGLEGPVIPHQDVSQEGLGFLLSATSDTIPSKREHVWTYFRHWKGGCVADVAGVPERG